MATEVPKVVGDLQVVVTFLTLCNNKQKDGEQIKADV